MLYCANCGTQAPDDAKFCPGCGAQRRAPTQPAKRKFPNPVLVAVIGVPIILVLGALLGGDSEPEVDPETKALYRRYKEACERELAAKWPGINEFRARDGLEQWPIGGPHWVAGFNECMEKRARR